MIVVAPDRTAIWLTDAGALDHAVVDGFSAWLGESERARCAHFARAQRRRQFLVGRALLRLMTARLLGLAPTAISLRERPGQAPALDLPGAPFIGFSISHSGRWVACAVSADSALGLDIECVDPTRDVVALADQAFDAGTAGQVRAAGAARQIDTFYRLWCLHEAGIKLAQHSAADHSWMQDGLAIGLRCAAKLDRPRIEVVTLGATAPWVSA